MNDYIAIPIPIHPDDKGLPMSCVQLKLPSGKLASLTIPIQGEKTIDNALATLAIWKATIVVAAPLYEI